jgi:hypothetical protein
MYAKVTPHGFDVYFGKLGLDAKDETLSAPMFALTIPADGREPWVEALLVCVEPAIGPPFGMWQKRGDAGTRNLMPNTFELKNDEKLPQHNEAGIVKVRVPDKRCNALQELMHQFAFHLFGEKPNQFQRDCTYAILADMWDAKAAKMVAVEALLDTAPTNDLTRYQVARNWARENREDLEKATMYKPFRPPLEFFSTWGYHTVLRVPFSRDEFAVAMMKAVVGEEPRSPEEQAKQLQDCQLDALKQLSLAAERQASLGQIAELRKELEEVKESVSELRASLSAKEEGHN